MKRFAIVLFVLTAWGHVVSSSGQVWTNAPPPVTPPGWTNNNAPPPPWYTTVQHAGVVAGVYSNLQFSQRGTQELTRIINALTSAATNGVNSVVNTTNPAGVASLAANVLYIGTNVTAGSTGALYRVESQVSGLGFTTPNGPTAFLTGTVATAGSFADTNSVGVISTNAVNQSTNVSARLASNVWAAADSTTNYVAKTGDTISGSLTITGGLFSVFRDSGQTLVSDFSQSNQITVSVLHNLGAGILFKHHGISTGNRGIFYANDTNILSTFRGGGSNYPAITFQNTHLNGIAGLFTTGQVWGAFVGDGAGLTNLSAFTVIATNGSGNVVTNLTFGGSVITQQMGTVTGGSGGSTNIYTRAQLGSLGGNVLLNAGNGYAQELVVTSSVTFAFATNAADTTAEFSVLIRNPSLFAVTWQTQTLWWVEGATPTMTTNAAFESFGFIVENFNATNYVRAYRRSGGVQ